MNQLLTYLTATGSFGAIVGALGDLAQMQERQYEVKYADGIPDATWRWAVGMPVRWSYFPPSGLGQAASEPGIPYKALRLALSLYNDSTVQQRLSSEPSSTLTGPDGDAAPLAPLARLLTASNLNNSKLIYAGGGMGYEIWEAPDGGKYAIWKLSSFDLSVSAVQPLYSARISAPWFSLRRVHAPTDSSFNAYSSWIICASVSLLVCYLYMVPVSSVTFPLYRPADLQIRRTLGQADGHGGSRWCRPPDL